MSWCVVICDVGSDSTLVAACTGRDTNLLVLDGGSGAEIHRLGHKCGLRVVILTQDGKYLASGDDYGGIFLWDIDFCHSPMKLWASDAGYEYMSDIYLLVTAVEVMLGVEMGWAGLFVVNNSGQCWVWSLVDLDLLFTESLESIDSRDSLKSKVLLIVSD